jgi:helix-turn-helix protein
MTTQQQVVVGQVPPPDRQLPGVDDRAPASDGTGGRRALYQRRELDEAVRLYQQGRSIREIAATQGRGFGTVRNHLADVVVMRPRGGRQPRRAPRQGDLR